jgi:SHS2 domain-containing protein
MPRYRILSHTADVGIIAGGATPAEAFESAAFGMFDLMFDLSRAPAPAHEWTGVVAADTPGELLVAWLSALLAEAEIRGLAFSAFRARAAGEGRLEGWAAGTAADAMELRGPPVKAVSYHDLSVAEVPGGWEVRVIFDV